MPVVSVACLYVIGAECMFFFFFSSYVVARPALGVLSYGLLFGKPTLRDCNDYFLQVKLSVFLGI